ncbi:MAG: transposase, partial [Isosphaeraceae bacterium]
MNFIGVDLHKKSITVCVMDEKRKVLARKTLACTQTDELLEFCRQFRPFKVVVEATASYLWFVELVEPWAEKVVLANPKKLRVIAESTKKTDRLDAQVLTEFLDMIPESYQPTPRQRQHRALVRHRQYLQGRITSVRSKIRHILSNYNADRKDLFSANRGLAYFKEVPLSGADRFVIKQLWAEWLDHVAQRLALTKKIKAFVAKAPQREKEARAILKT